LYTIRRQRFLLTMIIAFMFISAVSLIIMLLTVNSGDEEITLDKHRVVIMADDHNITVDTHAETVEEVLRQNKISIGEQDLVEPAANAKLVGGEQIRITRIEKNKSEEIEDIPFTTVKYNDDALPLGQEQVIQEGTPGKKRIIKSIRVENGIPVTEDILEESVQVSYIPMVVAVGTASPRPADELNSGVNLSTSAITVESNDERNSKKKNSDTGNEHKFVTIDALPVKFKYKLDGVELTAYDSGFDSTGKNPGDTDYGITASGTTVSEGRTIAVDPAVIPMGWWVYIEGVGYRRAEDTGGAIKGKIIDVYFDNSQVVDEFGRKRGISVYVIGPELPMTNP